MSKKQIAPEKKKSPARKAFRRFKNFISFLIIIGFAGFVFYMGWIQIRIPEGSYALIYTKTGGYDNHLTAPGVFVWRWENLFPTNMTIHLIELDRQPGSYSRKASLPSGSLYGEYIRQPSAFDYNLELDYTYSLKESAFTTMINGGSYNSSSLEAVYSDFESECSTQISRYMESILKETTPGAAELEEDLTELLSSMDNRISLNSLRVRNLTVPDRELYEKSRDLYLAELDKVKELEFQAQQIEVRIDSSTDRKMELLKQYGAVFSEYPVLLQYFELERDKLDPALLKDSEDLSPVSGSE